MKKNVLIMCLGLILAMFSAFTSNAADENTKISVDKKDGENGNEVKVNVSLSQNPGIAGIMFRLEYPPEVLEVEEAREKGKMSGATINVNKNGSITYVYASAYDQKENGVIMTVTFHIKDNAAPGTYFLNVVGTDAVNADEETVNIQTEDGHVRVLSKNGQNHAGNGEGNGSGTAEDENGGNTAGNGNEGNASENVNGDNSSENGNGGNTAGNGNEGNASENGNGGNTAGNENEGNASENGNGGNASENGNEINASGNVNGDNTSGNKNEDNPAGDGSGDKNSGDESSINNGSVLPAVIGAITAAAVITAAAAVIIRKRSIGKKADCSKK